MEAARTDRDRKEQLDRKLRLPARERGHVDGPTLVRWVWAAILSQPGAGKLSQYEQEAAQQLVCERVIRQHGPQPARENVGRSYLAEIAASVLTGDGTDSRSVRDVAGDYRTTKQRQQGSAAMIVPLPDEYEPGEDEDAGSTGGRSISRVALAVPGEPVPVVCWGTVPLADASARKLAQAIPSLSERQRASLRVALMAGGIAADGTRPGKALAVLAKAAGCSPRTAATRSAEGTALLRRIGRRNVATVVRHSAASLPMVPRDVPVLDEVLRAAEWLTDAARLDAYRSYIPGRAGTVALSMRAAGRRGPLATGPLRQWERPARPGHSDAGCSECQPCQSCQQKQERKRSEAADVWAAFIAARQSDPLAPLPQPLESARFWTLVGTATDDRAGRIGRAAMYRLALDYGCGLDEDEGADD